MTYDGHHSHLTTIISVIVFHRPHPHRHQRHHHRGDHDHLVPLSPNVDDRGLRFALRQTPHPVEVVISIQTLEQLRKLGCMSPNFIFVNFCTPLQYLLSRPVKAHQKVRKLALAQMG